MSRGESSSHPEDVRTAMLHLDEDVLRRIHALADKKNKDPMMLARDFIIERLYEEEKSEGILASPTSVPDPSLPVGRDAHSEEKSSYGACRDQYRWWLQGESRSRRVGSCHL